MKYIGLDIMGGDYAPNNCLEGAAMAVKELSDKAKIVLIGDSEYAKDFFQSHNVDPDLFDYVHTSEVIEMGEHPTRAYMSKPQSSIHLGFTMHKKGELDAFCSAGNSGAMLVGAMMTLKTISGIIRPSIATLLPKPNGKIGVLLDVGINADCRPDVLFQFGILGSCYAKEVYGIENPRVALLNIGEEPEKGNLVAQAAFDLMKDNTLYSFVGNVEGRDLFNDKSDVIVCEGFVGNVVLKTAEAFYRLIMKRGRSDDFFDKFNYELYGGTPVLGINGNILIGHGISSPLAFKNMLQLANQISSSDLNKKISEMININ
jgi:glycerol-3-phosphate acyltransferase PlsX